MTELSDDEKAAEYVRITVLELDVESNYKLEDHLQQKATATAYAKRLVKEGFSFKRGDIMMLIDLKMGERFEVLRLDALSFKNQGE